MNIEKTSNLDQLDQPPGPAGKSLWELQSDPGWHDWRWQLSHLLSTKDDFSNILQLTEQEILAFDSSGMFRVGVTPYFASQMDPHDPDCPIRRQVIPTAAEGRVSLEELTDSLGEDSHSPVPGLVHRYPDRVLMLINTQCASFCRFCTRSRLVGSSQLQFSHKDYQQQIDYIAANPVIRDVLLSGGDPLILPPAILESILQRLRAIPHVEVIRIGSRVPVFLPMRIDAELCSMLSKYHPLWMNIHFNHPNEITPEVRDALTRLSNAGIPLGSQTVLLAGINDCPQVMKKLFHLMVQNRVRPYYMYQCDLVPGTSHFRTPVGTGMQIMENLRGHTSGFAIPTFVIDAPQGGGKVPIAPQYLISQSDQAVVVRNYEGLITAYAQPETYPGHNSANCPDCRNAGKTDQKGVAALLSEEKRSIVPHDWHSSHQRSVPLPESLRGPVRVAKNGKNTAVKLQSPLAFRSIPPKSKRR